LTVAVGKVAAGQMAGRKSRRIATRRAWGGNATMSLSRETGPCPRSGPLAEEQWEEQEQEQGEQVREEGVRGNRRRGLGGSWRVGPAPDTSMSLLCWGGR